MKENKNCDNLENKVEHILISKTKFIYGIIIVMVPIVSFFFKIQLDVSLIKENHAAHTQAALERIEKLEIEEDNLREEIKLDHDAIVKLLTLYESIK